MYDRDQACRNLCQGGCVHLLLESTGSRSRVSTNETLVRDRIGEWEEGAKSPSAFSEPPRARRM